MSEDKDKNPPSLKEEPLKPSEEKEEDIFDFAESHALEALKKALPEALEELRRNPRKD